jgi:hypothetical protein
MKRLDKVYLRFQVVLAKIKGWRSEQKVRRAVLKRIAMVISAPNEKELYSSRMPHLYSFQEFKDICEDMGIPITIDIICNVRYIYLDRDKL